MAIGATTRRIAAFGASTIDLRNDDIAVEEPLEIRVAGMPVSVTMRTPGHDEDLALGFLFTEGIIRHHADVIGVTSHGPSGNTVDVTLSGAAALSLPRLNRHFYATSSCGVCGKASLAAIRTAHGVDVADDDFRITSELVLELPRRLRDAQRLFDTTGGLHAAGLFDEAGELECIREDVGRHNAVDKIIGARFKGGEVPADHHVLLVSGRASFELVQKAAMARIPALLAVGAPSSLAIELAEDVGMTLIGFVREQRFNVYAGDERVLRTAMLGAS